MIVCSCNVLSDRQIREVMSEQAPRMTSQVYGCLGCSAQCGRCARTIRRIMDQALAASGCPRACACCPAAARDDADSQGTAAPLGALGPADAGLPGQVS
ncbi:MAG: (2Fe-2S)-binding protein [Rhodovulum sp.]|nr:(2Fe-2S)-binding protein [Rhodovulum sp.]